MKTSFFRTLCRLLLAVLAATTLPSCLNFVIIVPANRGHHGPPPMLAGSCAPRGYLPPRYMGPGYGDRLPVYREPTYHPTIPRGMRAAEYMDMQRQRRGGR